MNMVERLISDFGMTEAEAKRVVFLKDLYDTWYHRLLAEGRTWRQAAEEAKRLVYD